MNKMDKKPITCPICQSSDCQIVFSDKIRNGAFPNQEDGEIFKCSNCNTQFLGKTDNKINYQDNSYRESLNQEANIDSFRKHHDHLQLNLLNLVGTENIRNKSVLDIGCGGGSFLDNIKGLTNQISCVEPNIAFQKSLRNSGYEVFNDINDINGKTYDLLTAFHVIEHVDDPVSFLKFISEKMNLGSRLIITTPNLNDILFNTLYEYKQFFYRKAHNFYFDEISLRNLGNIADLNCKKFTFKHRYSASNFFYWLKDKKPCGNKKFDGINYLFDKFWASYLEQFKISEMIAVEYVKNI